MMKRRERWKTKNKKKRRIRMQVLIGDYIS